VFVTLYSDRTSVAFADQIHFSLEIIFKKLEMRERRVIKLKKKRGKGKKRIQEEQ
jgi:hypothetical protein